MAAITPAPHELNAIPNPDSELEHNVVLGVFKGVAAGLIIVGVLMYFVGRAVGLEAAPSAGLGLFFGFWSGTIAGALVGGISAVNRAGY